MFENTLIRIEIEESEIPWLKVFTQETRKEFTECTLEERDALFKAIACIETEMLSFYNPIKINIASFGNYVPLVHWHVMARFEDDSFFPEPMWGKKQRNTDLNLPSFNVFCDNVRLALEKDFS